jgi:hypothetical protein
MLMKRGAVRCRVSVEFHVIAALGGDNPYINDGNSIRGRNPNFCKILTDD